MINTPDEEPTLSPDIPPLPCVHRDDCFDYDQDCLFDCFDYKWSDFALIKNNNKELKNRGGAHESNNK